MPFQVYIYNILFLCLQYLFQHLIQIMVDAIEQEKRSLNVFQSQDSNNYQGLSNESSRTNRAKCYNSNVVVTLLAASLLVSLTIMFFLLNQKLQSMRQIMHEVSYLTKFKNPSQVVQVAYFAGPSAKMPLNTRQLNADSKTIEEVLYPNPGVRKQRIRFEEERRSFIGKGDERFSLKKELSDQLRLIQYNNPLNDSQYKKGVQENERQWVRLEAKFKLSAVKTELPMCIIVPSYNNNDKFRIQHNLNSLFMQNYTNYKVVIVDDFSSDNSIQMYQKYFEFYKIDKKHYSLLSNSKRVTALPNIYFSTINHCKKSSIVLLVDGDDQLIGMNTLQLFNWGYQTMKLGVLYTNFIQYQVNKIIYDGPTLEYTQSQKANNLYRERPKFTHLNSYRAQLLRAVNIESLIDQDGNIIDVTYDQALWFPLIQLSCGRVHKIDGQFSYLYNTGTGLNDYALRQQHQQQVSEYLKNSKKYTCLQQFDQRMKQQ